MNGKKAEDEKELAVYSFSEYLSEKDFSIISNDELAEVIQIVKELSKSLAINTNRRF